MLVELSPMLSPYSRYSYWPWGLPRPRIRRAREPARNSKIIWCRDDPSKSTTVLALIPTFLAILTFLGPSGGKRRAHRDPVALRKPSLHFTCGTRSTDGNAGAGRFSQPRPQPLFRLLAAQDARANSGLLQLRKMDGQPFPWVRSVLRDLE